MRQEHLLRLIAGLESMTPAASASGQDAKPEDVRVMFQEPRLLPWARVLSNVEVGLGRDRSSSGARQRAEAALTRFGLADKRAQWLRALRGTEAAGGAGARAGRGPAGAGVRRAARRARCVESRISMQRLLERVWQEQASPRSW